MNYRKKAKGQRCQLQFPGVCSRDPEQTVLCHLRMGGIGGMGVKPHDLCSVLACSQCHDVLDGRRPKPEWIEDWDFYKTVLEGHLRTLVILLEGE